ncbi:MAG TPA: D-alanyl-D-alanine carboxypeptidase family protein, partial [Bacillota bacterium]|nr:D-alanyl-D-alanine carboxypeptidase family protein [Bacillota bacterium]
DKIPTTATAAGMGGSQVYLKEGEELTLHEMFKAIAVVSANDASTAVAEYLYGSDEDFIGAMNQKVQQLGLKNTHFVNETGLPDPNHYSSAYDLAVLSRELLKHPKVLQYTSIWMDSLRDGKFVLKNTNNLIKVYQGADGLKTGHTNEAKFCLSATAKKDNLRLISVILGADSNGERVAQTRRLLDYGFRTYEKRVIKRSGAEVGRIELPKAQPTNVGVKIKQDLAVLSERGNDEPVKTRLVPIQNLKLPLAAGAKVGVLKAIQAEKEIGQTAVYTMQPVKKANFIVLGWRALVNFIANLFNKK